MRIVYISKYTILPQYGSPTRQYFLSKWLSRIDDNEVMLIGSRSTLGNVPPVKGLAMNAKEGNLQMVTLDGPKINLGFNMKRLMSWMVFEWNLLRFRKKIKEFKPDVIIVSSLSILTFLTGVYLKRRLKAKLVVEVRDIYPLTLVAVGNYSSSHPVVRLLGWVEKYGYKNADLIVSTLPNAKEHIAGVLKAPFNFKWIPMGVDMNYYSDGDNNAKPVFPRKKSPNEFWVGYAGTIGKANALDTIFDAAKELQYSHPEIKFYFIGDGAMKSQYQNAHADQPNVHFLPAVPKRQLQGYLEEMDVLINTWLDKSIYQYGISPNKWIDYMLAARPMLVAFSGFRCIVNEADCGVFVKAESKSDLVEGILKLSAMSRDELTAMGLRGRKYLLENLSYQRLADELYNSLQSVTENKG
jgi:glycosyltransferase involved in cell wall biosynthesis